jgi:hypothetical protein
MSGATGVVASIMSSAVMPAGSATVINNGMPEIFAFFKEHPKQAAK